MNQSRSGPNFAGPTIMIISAVLFGYFGFFAGMTSATAGGQVVLFYAILLWTLRIGAIGFALSAGLSFILPLIGNLVYALFGIGTSIGLVIVAVMDIADTSHIAAIPPFWAFLFAAWNGYGSWMSLREIVAARSAGVESPVS